LLLTLACSSVVSGLTPNGIFFPLRNSILQSSDKTPIYDTNEYTVHWFNQKVDHFAFNRRQPNSTFKMKYLVRDKYYKKEANPPILFYCGNEGPVEMFYSNSGFLNDNLAEHFSALVV